MKALVGLLLSGALWLGVIQTSTLFGVPPQIVSLSRSGYIAIFSIYLMVELRGQTYSRNHRPKHLYLYLIPLLSLLILSLMSPDLQLTGRLLLLVGCFYLCAFALVNMRSEWGGIRTVWWDLIAAPLLLVLMLNRIALATGAILCVIYLIRLVQRPADDVDDNKKLDALIVQLPSICVAPVILIALRDVFSGGGVVGRAQVESFGLVVNGVGGALWTATVMRGTLPLNWAALWLWAASLVGAMVLAMFPINIITSATAIVLAEGLRGAMWLGTTVALAKLTRAKGLMFNIAATILPLGGLWASQFVFAPAATLLVYATIVAPIPLAAQAIIRRRSGGAASPVDQATDHFDSSHSPSRILEGKS